MLRQRSKWLLLPAVSLVLVAQGCSGGRRDEPAEAAGRPETSELVAEADRLYERRESPERAREALALLRRALAADYKSYEAAWKLARAGFYVGTHGGGEEKARLEAFREGIAAGEAAVRIEPNRPEGHFWLGACIGGRAKLQGPLYALSSAGDIRREMEEVIKLDEGFQAGSAYLALGQLDLELPEILGGDDTRALQNLEKGLQFGQNNALLRLRLAEAYFRLKRHAEARAQARAILEMKPSPGYEPEYKQAAEGAKRLLEKIK